MRHSRSAPGGRKRKQSSSDEDFHISSDEDTVIIPREEGARITTRRQTRSVSYNSFDSAESEEFEESEEENLDIFGNGKIDKIFLARESSAGLEYLVSFQESSEPFSQWLTKETLSEFSNFGRVLEKFNDTELQFSHYCTAAPPFDTSYKSPMHVIAHRPMNNDPESTLLEFLCQFNLETGTAFVWEPRTGDSPQELIDNYMATRVRVENKNPKRPEECEISEEEGRSFVSKDGKVPRDYQVAGVNWMLKCFCADHGCILADEMGLGKTIQCLTMLMKLHKSTEFHGPYMIAVRTNTFTQWCSELERWSDLKYIAYSGSPETRFMMREYMMPYFNDQGVKEEGVYGFQVLLVTYEIFLKDFEFFKAINWQVLFIDEGHRIKNDEGKKHNAFMALPVMHRIILTGTPIQSTLHELWTLLNFVSPEYFVDSSMFPEDDVESLDEDVLNQLKELIAPHLMRRSLLDVEKSVVPKDERIAFLRMTDVQRELTRLTKLHELWRVAPDANKLESNILHRICNHPFLVEGAEKYYLAREHGKLSRIDLLVSSSAKFLFLDRILPIFRKSKRSVLIFSQRVKILNLLSEYCKLRKYTHSILVGTLSEAEKKAEIDRFCDDSQDVFIFLISTRSGSEGLNLTKASITIIFDPDWNPQNDLQALGRCHRIGQTQKVDVIRLITYGTYEHHMFAKAQRKLRLWTTLLGDGETSDPTKARKIEVAQEETKREPVDTLLGLSATQDAELAGVFAGSVHPIEEEPEQKVVDVVIPEPPDLEMLDEPDDEESIDEAIEHGSTIVRDMSILGSSRKIPELDLSFGMPDAEFLEQFPVDASTSIDVGKHRSRAAENQRVELDPKLAKKILVYLELRGYGEWEAIAAGINYFVPVLQLTKFCQAAIVLHFRALEASKVSCFPLLIWRLVQDIPNFEISALYCGDISEWYSILAKRSYLVGEAKVCKLISNHIHKTAYSCLSSLESHLLICEWKRLIQPSASLKFDELPPMPDRTREKDEKLYEALLANDTELVTNDDITRVSQIFHLMKGQMLLYRVPINRYIIEFWTNAELKAVMDTVRNFGNALIYLQPHELHSRTALLSKNAFQVKEMTDWFVRDLSQRKPDNTSDVVAPEYIAHLERAPLACRDGVSVSALDATTTVKRIMICGMIRRAITNIQMKEKEQGLDTPVTGGQQWWNLRHCMNLFVMLRKYGMDALPSILVTPSLDFASHLTDDDRKFLTTFDKSYLKPESKLPTFLINETKFYTFLKAIAGVLDQKAAPHPAQRPMVPPMRVPGPIPPGVPRPPMVPQQPGAPRVDQKPYVIPRPPVPTAPAAPTAPGIQPSPTPTTRPEFDTKGPQEQRELMLKMWMEQKTQPTRLTTPASARAQKTAVLVGLPSHLTRCPQLVADAGHPSTPQSQPIRPVIPVRQPPPTQQPVVEPRPFVPLALARTIKFELTTPNTIHFTTEAKKPRVRDIDAAPRRSKQKKRSKKYDYSDYSD